MRAFIFYSSYLVFPILAAEGYFLFKLKSKKSRIISIALITASLLFVYARFIEPNILVIKHQQIEAELPSMKIAVFSDMHYGVYKNAVSIERIVEKVNQENPDVVFIPGDFAYYLKKDDIKKVLAGISKLKAPAFAIIGNHDLGISRDGKEEDDISVELKEFLEDAGVKVLKNEIDEFEISGDKIKIIGLDDFWSGDADYDLLKKVSQNDYTIVLAHNPDAVYEFSKESRNNADLVVSGHTHGGQIRIPILYKLAIPTEHDFDHGLYNVDGVKTYITPGIGMTGLPLRFLMLPRVDIIEVKS